VSLNANEFSVCRGFQGLIDHLCSASISLSSITVHLQIVTLLHIVLPPSYPFTMTFLRLRRPTAAAIRASSPPPSRPADQSSTETSDSDRNWDSSLITLCKEPAVWHDKGMALLYLLSTAAVFLGDYLYLSTARDESVVLRVSPHFQIFFQVIPLARMFCWLFSALIGGTYVTLLLVCVTLHRHFASVARASMLVLGVGGLIACVRIHLTQQAVFHPAVYAIPVSFIGVLVSRWKVIGHTLMAFQEAFYIVMRHPQAWPLLLVLELCFQYYQLHVLSVHLAYMAEFRGDAPSMAVVTGLSLHLYWTLFIARSALDAVFCHITARFYERYKDESYSSTDGVIEAVQSTFTLSFGTVCAAGLLLLIADLVCRLADITAKTAKETSWLLFPLKLTFMLFAWVLACISSLLETFTRVSLIRAISQGKSFTEAATELLGRTSSWTIMSHLYLTSVISTVLVVTVLMIHWLLFFRCPFFDSALAVFGYSEMWITKDSPLGLQYTSGYLLSGFKEGYRVEQIPELVWNVRVSCALICFYLSASFIWMLEMSANTLLLMAAEDIVTRGVDGVRGGSDSFKQAMRELAAM
jgi:hypothetical protein